MEFLADENIAPRAIEALRKEGFTIHTISEQRLISASDEKIIVVAQKNKWIIITHDKDFGNLLHYPLRSHAGVILLRLKNQSPHNVIRHLIPFLKTTDIKKIKGRLVIFREDRIKII